MLEKSIVPIAMAQGVDTKADPKQLPVGKMTVLENAMLLKTGEIKKVPGYSQYSVSNDNSPLHTAATLKDTIITFSEDEVFSWCEGNNRKAQVGRYSKFNIQKLPAINQNSFYANTAYDFSNNVIMHVWSVNDGAGNYALKYMVMFADDNTILQPETQISASGYKARVITSNDMDYFLIVWEDQSGFNLLKATAVSKGLWSIYTTVTLASGSPTYSGYGFTLYTKPTGGILPYVAWSAGSLPAAADTRIAVFTNVYASFVAPTSVLLSGIGSKSGSAIADYGTSDIMFACNDQLNIKTIVYNAALSSVVASVRTIMTTSGIPTFYGVVIQDFSTNNTIMSIYTTTLTGTLISEQPKIEQAIVTSTTTLQTQRVYIQGASLAGPSLDFTESTILKTYLPIKILQSYSSNVAAGYSGLYTLYLIESFNANYTIENPPNQYVAAKFYDLNAAEFTPLSGLGQPEYTYFSKGLLNSVETYFGTVKETAGNSSLCIINKNCKPVTAELANNLHITGGYLGMFDGVEFAEHNFFQYPLQPYLTNIGAGNILPGTYYYSVIYVWQDALGQLHESAPSDPIAITLSSSTHKVSVEVSTLKLTNKKSQVFIEIYRSNDGVLFYKLAGGIGSSLRTDKTVSSITYTDNTSQANIISNKLLYTVGGEVSNISAPACSYVSNYKRRLIVTPSEDPNAIWFSKDIIPAYAGTIGTPVSFANEFVKSVDERGGGVTATIQLDDKLVIFKKDSISVMVGEGPANNGLQDDFTTPQLIVSDTGCEYGRSVVIMPLGVMFQSPKGLYLCDRSLSVSYLGAPVENFNSIQCTSANLRQDLNEVWFGLNNSNILVFNYYFDQWSSVYWPTSDIAIHKSDVIAVYGRYMNRQYEFFYKNSVGYSMTFTTGWMSFAQIQGFQRVYKLLILGLYKSAHRLQIQVSYDFDDTVAQTTIIDVPSSVVPYEWRVFLSRQKCTAIKFTIKDLSPTVGAWNESFSLSNLALEIGVKRGLNKLPASKSVG